MNRSIYLLSILVIPFFFLSPVLGWFYFLFVSLRRFKSSFVLMANEGGGGTSNLKDRGRKYITRHLSDEQRPIIYPTRHKSPSAQLYFQHCVSILCFCFHSWLEIQRTVRRGKGGAAGVRFKERIVAQIMFPNLSSVSSQVFHSISRLSSPQLIISCVLAISLATLRLSSLSCPSIFKPRRLYFPSLPSFLPSYLPRLL